jgi:Fe-S-cluster-containing dehydrogenase component
LAFVETAAGLCTTCRACEVACHFHHTRTFGAAASSVEIRYDADTAAVEILLYPTCDGCIDESSPFCARFCAPGAIRAGQQPALGTG